MRLKYLVVLILILSLAMTGCFSASKAKITIEIEAAGSEIFINESIVLNAASKKTAVNSS